MKAAINVNRLKIKKEGEHTMSRNKTPGEGTMAVWAGEDEPF
jgi:hypothetical protein